MCRFWNLLTSLESTESLLWKKWIEEKGGGGGGRWGAVVDGPSFSFH